MSGLFTRVRLAVTDQLELHERRALMDAPWEEDYLHWAWEDRAWVLHGHLVPPRGWRRRSVTARGWCPGVAAQRPTEEAGS